MSGGWAKILDIKFKGEGEVFNFSVANNNNYYVGNSRLLTHNTKKCGGKTPTEIDPQQLQLTIGTLGKSQFFPHLDADNLVKQAWEMGTPYVTIP